MGNKLFTKEEIGYIKYLIDKDTDNLSKLEGAISDDGWIYDIYDRCDSIIDKLNKMEDTQLISDPESSNNLRAFKKLKSKVHYDEDNLKYVIEVEIDDFASSNEWFNFKKAMQGGE